LRTAPSIIAAAERPPTNAPAARRGDLWALLAGAATPLAFAPFGLAPLALLAPAVLFAAWLDAGAARAAWRGFLYGCGLFGVGVSWVYVSLHVYGRMPAPLAALAVALFVAALAVFPALVGAAQARGRSLGTGTRLIVVMPALWTLSEWIRGWFLTGFPWLALGYSQSDTWLAGFAPWLGVYGVGYAVALSAGLLAGAWRLRRRRLACLAALALLWAAGALAALPEWVRPAGAPLRVALVQGNVGLDIKWQPAHLERIVARYLALSAEAGAADLIVWPEAAVPGYFDRVAPVLLPRLEQRAREQGADFLVGAIERDARTGAHYNTVFALGDARGRYRKQHLVPFGEYLPLPALFRWVIDYLHIPMSNFSAGGDEQAPVRAAGRVIGVSVCYEDAFGEELIASLPEAELLVNVSEDSWFGDSLAPHQRIQMARLRTLETGRPMLRAANTGPSVLIDHRGRVTARSPQFEAHVVTGRVQPMAGATPYARLGNAPVTVLVALLLVVAAGVALWRHRARCP